MRKGEYRGNIGKELEGRRTAEWEEGLRATWAYVRGTRVIIKGIANLHINGPGGGGGCVLSINISILFLIFFPVALPPLLSLLRTKERKKAK